MLVRCVCVWIVGAKKLIIIKYSCRVIGGPSSSSSASWITFPCSQLSSEHIYIPRVIKHPIDLIVYILRCGCNRLPFSFIGAFEVSMTTLRFIKFVWAVTGARPRNGWGWFDYVWQCRWGQWVFFENEFHTVVPMGAIAISRILVSDSILSHSIVSIFVICFCILSIWLAHNKYAMDIRNECINSLCGDDAVPGPA